MKPVTSLVALRPATSFLSANGLRASTIARSYATQNTQGPTPLGPKRRSVTPFNDDGYVPWRELSIPEKAARATQQSFNFGLVLVGLVLTGGVGYLLWTDVFSPNSKTVQFNRAIDKIKKDDRCLELFGDAKKILAHGEETNNKWQRARPLASSERVDKQGVHHLLLHFHVEGPRNHGVAQVHMVKLPGHSDYEYKYLFVDVKGHERIYLENSEANRSATGKKGFTLFGAKWN
ncbi:Mitochondrial import inner membrane translocase subunit TIM21 [Beauveria bassiana]|uniref:Mitochondrial import inner membrane translocase subunit Tim21 n=1 Tax=Beauveria bassiana (strain ARSEF 2860) TaxID=655819 RepID=J5JSW7_BEAB2|nr:import inner membrane translocase subunit tim-21, mitochondrial [Beauveria bassiana ARSEF 2860]EJP65726.1 import inner membrane translocase subunit tim-21, mitochondrial [Beauveria bassiana ARSEF 2860]KAF1737647.1 Mitochondrial import inner membrane translocase subunit TIM21 [Beauveria bassiana]KAH8718675.1 Mitochondrial import inner membrane translocase subunit TIM21 [Beauveria bassiana]